MEENYSSCRQRSQHDDDDDDIIKITETDTYRYSFGSFRDLTGCAVIIVVYPLLSALISNTRH